MPKGNYTLFTIPTPDRWTLIISKKTGEWGIPCPSAQYDFARLPMKVSHLSSSLEDLTSSFVPSGNVCTMHVDWEQTRASVKIAEKKWRASPAFAARDPPSGMGSAAPAIPRHDGDRGSNHLSFPAFLNAFSY